MENKKGFTLAEVLITLTIIGIVAALTIPTLINNVNEAQYNAGVKDSFNKLSQALSMIQSNNGGIVHVGVQNNSSQALMNDFCNVMSCSQINQDLSAWISSTNYLCYKGSNAGDCNLFSNLDSMRSHGNNPVGAVLNNGAYMGFFDDGGSVEGYTDINIVGDVMVDINGINNGPNMAGQDLHFFHIAQDSNGVYSIVPFGIPDDIGNFDSGSGCSLADGSGGMTCTYQRLYGSMP